MDQDLPYTLLRWKNFHPIYITLFTISNISDETGSSEMMVKPVFIDYPVFSNIDRKFRSRQIDNPPSPPPFLKSPWPDVTSPLRTKSQAFYIINGLAGLDYKCCKYTPFRLNYGIVRKTRALTKKILNAPNRHDSKVQQLWSLRVGMSRTGTGSKVVQGLCMIHRCAVP